MSVVIFTFALIVYMRVTSNISDSDERLLEELKYDSSFIADSLAGEGHPDGWIPSNVEKPGITDGSYRVNDSKYSQFKNISYIKAKSLFGTRHEFIAFLLDTSQNVINVNDCYLGNYSVSNITPDTCPNITINASYLAKSERLVYRNKTLKLVVYTWRK